MKASTEQTLIMELLKCQADFIVSTRASHAAKIPYHVCLPFYLYMIYMLRRLRFAEGTEISSCRPLQLLLSNPIPL